MNLCRSCHQDFSSVRLHEALGDLPPAEYEELNIKTDNTPMVAAT